MIEEPGAARRGQEGPGEAKSGQEEPGGASQEGPRGARRGQEERGGEEEPGRAERSQEAPPGSFWAGSGLVLGLEVAPVDPNPKDPSEQHESANR